MNPNLKENNKKQKTKPNLEKQKQIKTFPNQKGGEKKKKSPSGLKHCSPALNGKWRAEYKESECT